ncbi:hypothetical protein EPR50_G00140500 [Perca flavescens]|uniref:Uncharacterized protein n=1 Tax=Perca flavescens TaxID=8167 RepID=A0A484CTV9_PERFV|nr:hypothetical protein EPR50_G00140500 [Perca flavescens]
MHCQRRIKNTGSRVINVEALLPSPFVQSSRWVESEGGCANPTYPYHCGNTDKTSIFASQGVATTSPSLLARKLKVGRLSDTPSDAPISHRNLNMESDSHHCHI